MLAFVRENLLPAPHTNFFAVWRSLDDRQRRIVDLAAKSRRKDKYEGASC